ncbi:MAG: Hsp20/alpha crystallin family protein [Kiritimatiellae bacterium]|nr:Hsp20/alpha crystallin family protein [Kiritimatiellia bacterium]MDW8458851.1 Hsp20/alpha crystallin family protein [Verrucomicrobiota bacterium]
MTKQATEVQVQRAEQMRDLPVYSPATDIYETDKEIVVVMDLPGVRQDQIDITLENRVLTVSARNVAEEPAGREVVYREFGSAEYRRSFTLTEDVDRNGISARIKNGVLRLVLPKAVDAQPRRIEVRAE